MDAAYICATRKLEYDIYTPSKKLAVEYHGLHFHSDRTQHGQRDFEKYNLSLTQGDLLIQVYSDEWKNKHKRKIFEAMITDILAPEPKPLVGSVLDVFVGDTHEDLQGFLTKYHLFGSADGFLTALARHNDSIVGAWVFSQDRDEPGVALLDRACFSYEYDPGDAHQRALDMALPLLKERGYTKLLAFADNRFDTGELYERLGFEFEGSVEPELMYVRGTRRKSSQELGVVVGDEVVVKVKGKKWYRIWDSGKKRYSLPI